MQDELKKFGLRLRPRVVRPRQDADAAPFSWGDTDMKRGEERRSSTAADELKLVDDVPDAAAPIRNNAGGTSVGYNPYESGLLQPRRSSDKRDLRELSKWIEMQKKLGKPTK